MKTNRMAGAPGHPAFKKRRSKKDNQNENKMKKMEFAKMAQVCGGGRKVTKKMPEVGGKTVSSLRGYTVSGPIPLPTRTN